MKRAYVLVAALLTLAMIGNGSMSAVNRDSKDKGDRHAHGTGPQGGVVFDLGRYNAEFTVDHQKKECAVSILGPDEKKLLPVAAKELTIVLKETRTQEGKVVAKMTIKLQPRDPKEGKAAKFVGTDPGLANVAEFEGTVSGEIDGRPVQSQFKE